MKIQLKTLTREMQVVSETVWRGQCTGKKAVTEKSAPEQPEQGTTHVPRSPQNSGLTRAQEQSPYCRQLHKQGRDTSQEQPQKGKHRSVGE